MKKAVLIGLVALAVGLVPARTASAQAGVIRWIAKLSGPGTFVGPGYEFYPLCYGKKSGVLRFQDPKPRDPLTAEQINAQPFVAGLDLNCRSFSRNNPLVKVGFQVSQLWGNNNLQYDPFAAPSATDTVELKVIEGTADVGLLRGRLELGAGIGLMHFNGTPVGGFSHPIYDIRTTFHVIPMLFWNRTNEQSGQTAEAERYRQDWLQVRLDLTIIPGGLEDTDFGAIPGTFPRTDAEFNPAGAILVNLGNLFNW